MSLQKLPRFSCQLMKQSSLPSIHKLKAIQNNSNYLATDRYNQYMSTKLDKAMNPQNIFQTSRQRQKASVMLISDRQTKPQSKIQLSHVKMQAARSMPKLSINKSPQKRRQTQRFRANERLSIQLNIPKARARKDSVGSDDSYIKEKLLNDEKQSKVEPIVYVLKKNTDYNQIKERQESKMVLTQTQLDGSRMSIRQNTSTFPMMPNIPSRQQPLYTLPKHEKYIREKFVGQQAINRFYNRYKNIEKVRQMEHFKLEFNPLTIILTILQSYNIPPKKMEIIKLKGEEAILDLKNCALGGSVSIKAISEIIEKVSIFQQIDLSYNQITPDLTDIIIPNLSKMKVINLAYNKIGRRGVELLTEMFFNEEIDEDCQLQQLNLESNNITDGSFGNFFVNLSNMNELLVLNLSKNYLGNTAAQKIKQFLIQDHSLTELYLHWCELGTKATKTIFEGLVHNLGLKVLDLSWNQVGIDGVPAFCKFLRTNKCLAHLDVSYCDIDQTNTVQIAQALKHNQSIYGIHYQGNAGFVDYKGHLHVIKKDQLQNPLSIRTDLIQRINSVNIIPNYYHRQIQGNTGNICWICEGWSQKYFKINKEPNQKGCFLHLDFELYNGVLMHDQGTYYEILRMCPPAPICLFYTKVMEKKLVHCCNPVIVGQIKAAQGSTLPDFRIEKNIFKEIKLETVNFIEQPRYFGNIFNQDYLTQVHCQPRTDDMRGEHLLVFPVQQQVVKPPKKKKIKPPKPIVKKPVLTKQIEVKTIPDNFESVFDKDSGKGDYDNFIRKCVDFDMSHSKVPKIIKNPQQLQEVRTLLEKNYDLFQKIYYYLANNNPTSHGVYSINQTRFQKFVQEQRYETKKTTMAKIRLKLISCLATGSTEGQIRWFYRPQFFQFLLRLAIEKWATTVPARGKQSEAERLQRQKYCLSISEAFENMLKTLKKYEQRADSKRWKDQNLTSYDLSIVIKSYNNLFEQIYEKYAGMTQRNMNTQMKKNILLDELKSMFLQAGIRKSKEALKDLEIAYRTAKKLQIEDGVSDTGLDFTQFLEAFCRFAEGLYLIPIGSESDHLWQKQLVKSSQIPLFLKVQKLLKQLYLTNYDFHNKKYDLLFSHGLFSEEVAMLIQYYKKQHQSKEVTAKNFLSLHARMNSIDGGPKKITLNDLVDMVAVKAKQIRESNRQKILEMEAEQLRIQSEIKRLQAENASSGQEDN